MGGRVRGRLLDGIIAGLLTGHFMPDLSQFREFICNDFFQIDDGSIFPSCLSRSSRYWRKLFHMWGKNDEKIRQRALVVRCAPTMTSGFHGHAYVQRC